MSEAQKQVRHAQQIDELCAAFVRAYSGEPDLHFRGQRLHRGRQPLPWYAPHLHPSPESDDFASFRGTADGLALRLSASDADLHERLRPDEPVERMLFEMLEQFRVESLAPEAMPGMRRNLRHRHEQWSLSFHHSGLTDTARGLLLYAVAQICRARVSGQQVVEETEDMLEATRFALSPLIGHALAGLRRERADQAAYAVHARAIAHTVAAMLHAAGEDQDGEEDRDAEPDDKRSVFSLVADMDREIVEAFTTADAGRSALLEGEGDAYRVFTTDYDREHAAASLVRRELLVELRETLDRRIAAQGINIARLARELRALLAEPQRQGWDGAQEEGRIDGRRLAQLVASPTERRLFRTERLEPVADCVVGFLIDCSGSMKAHAEAVAMLVDVMARALEQAGVASEILGFTTGAWNGGRARRDWLRAGRPAHPGRLNERCHLVFKDAGTPWRRARPAIAALLKPDLFREGCDGEAVDWACERLGARAEERKLLLVMSDGSPMDSATNLANDAHYLDHHLQDVVARHEQAGRIGIAGVGVGLDLSPYYSRSHVLDLAAAGGAAMFLELIGLLAGFHRR
ncbi:MULTISPECIES: cobalt chelatase [unclassified Variovorax]|uniref:cobaltochelatase CobT-related protein n=3 Tax=Variovorax TaxID=34072 RepID=UPI000C997EC3|nr:MULTISPECIES: cobalt chelatase [unclassified Variovorax]PNG46809.1 Aerobic cobaltochelatase subunit CobT [Variovorax sp. B2]PNG48539.1 Aerobic cobaltochelatase subunit CobT [Variovorax sp. B4]VTV14622.1 Aerobic cobaltochelatase subunit CobT [Variovorax sp. WDL1]